MTVCGCVVHMRRKFLDSRICELEKAVRVLKEMGRGVG